MMAMARRMGGGDPRKGMVRMMEMMGLMDGMMGGDRAKRDGEPVAPHSHTH